MEGGSGGAYPETVSLYPPSSLRSPDRRLLIGGALAGLSPLGACSGPIVVDKAAGRSALLAVAAQTQLGVTRGYDPKYRVLAYPGGDVSRKTGVCCDVVIRAARDGLGLDLQKLVHEDMVGAFDAYPSRRLWGLSHPDANIDHRRVPNLETWFARQGAEIWRSKAKTRGGFPAPLKAGDILTWRSWRGGPHIGIVSRGGDHPMIIHNMGAGVMQHGLWLMALRQQHAAGLYRWPATS